MAKTPKKVDQKLLVRAIEQAEKDGPLRNLQALWEATCKIYNGLVGETQFPEITPSVVMLRVERDWHLSHKTVAGKKGRGALSDEQKAAMQAGRQGGRTSKAEKFAKNPAIAQAHKLLRERTPERFHNLVDQVEAGSRSAAVKLNCLECSAYVTSEVRQCVCSHCPLFAFRPYQGSVEADEVEELDTEELMAEVA
jgi:hypothetical protein